MPNCSDNLSIIPMTAQGCTSTDVKMEFGNQCATGLCAGITNRPNRSRVREQIKDYVLLMLGAPTIRIELDPQQLDLAVDQALRIVEEWAPKEFFQYYVFQTNPGQSVYSLPEEIAFVRNIFYRKMQMATQTATDLGGAIPLEYMYGSSSTFGFLTPAAPIWGAAGEWTAYKQYEQMYNRMSSSIGGFEFLGDERTVKLYPIPCFAQQAIVQYIQKCKDWKDVLVSMQEGAHAFALIMLGRLRSKYTTMPGPSGGLVLDGASLVQEGIQAKMEFEQKLLWRFGECCHISIG